MVVSMAGALYALGAQPAASVWLPGPAALVDLAHKTAVIDTMHRRQQSAGQWVRFLEASYLFDGGCIAAAVGRAMAVCRAACRAYIVIKTATHLSTIASCITK